MIQQFVLYSESFIVTFLKNKKKKVKKYVGSEYFLTSFTGFWTYWFWRPTYYSAASLLFAVVVCCCTTGSLKPNLTSIYNLVLPFVGIIMMPHFMWTVLKCVQQAVGKKENSSWVNLVVWWQTAAVTEKFPLIKKVLYKMWFKNSLAENKMWVQKHPLSSAESG